MVAPVVVVLVPAEPQVREPRVKVSLVVKVDREVRREARTTVAVAAVLAQSVRPVS
jgi:hypothetical protein